MKKTSKKTLLKLHETDVQSPSVSDEKSMEVESLDLIHKLNKRYDSEDYFIKNHLVFGERVLMGVCHLSLGIQFAREKYNGSTVEVNRVVFKNAIRLDKGEAVSVVLNPELLDVEEGFSVKSCFYVSSESEIGLDDVDRYEESASFEVIKSDNSLNEYMDLDECFDVNKKQVKGERFYRDPSQECYGEPLYSVKNVVYLDDFTVAGVIKISGLLKESMTGFDIPPCVLDGCHVISSFCFGEDVVANHHVPLMVKRVVVEKDIQNNVLDEWYCIAKRIKSNDHILEFDIKLFNSSGRQVCLIEGFTTKKISNLGVLPDQPNTELEKEPKALKQTNISDYIESLLKSLTGSSLTEDDLESNFMELGLDSVSMIRIVSRIENDINIELYPTLLFEFQNINSLSVYFEDEFGDKFKSYFSKTNENKKEINVQNKKNAIPEEVKIISGEVSNENEDNNHKYKKESPIESSSSSNNSDDEIAIIGMSGNFAESENLTEFWRNIELSKDLVKEIPSHRWDHSKWFDEDRNIQNKTYSKWGSFIDDMEYFDPKFFGISPRQANWVDPQLRLLLQSAQETFEDAGVINEIHGSNTGVYIGTCFHEYWDEIVRLHVPFSDYQSHSSAMSTISGTVSYTFDLQGASIPLDNACASSLTALHLACQSLKAGESDQAFVAGVNLLLSPLHYVHFARLQALSPTGRCYAFDERADGYVPGEGIVSVLLKPLSKAKLDGDNIHSIIRASGINHVGHSNNPTAPRPELQTALLQETWRKANINPRDLSYIESHGTGTKVGDPIEVNALKKAFQPFTSDTGFCAIGSTKSHIGHLEGAAGLASLVKVILMMKHKTIPVMPNFETLNDYIKFDHSPFYINNDIKSWEPNKSGAHLAGVSSFGMTGNNAHVVVEGYEHQSNVSERENYVILLSADSQAQVKDSANRLLKFITHDLSLNTPSIDIGNIAYTLQMGRQEFFYRCVFIVKDLDDLQRMLSEYVDGNEHLENIFLGSIKNKKNTKELFSNVNEFNTVVKKAIQNNDMAALANYWVQGLSPDWSKLYTNGAKPRRISLPSYPFLKQKFWMNRPEVNRSTNNYTLIQESSDANEIIYSVTFDGNEFFLRDHVVGGNKVLPGVVYLDLVVSAINMMNGDVSRALKLTKIVWLKPVVVDEKIKTIFLRLDKSNVKNIKFEIYNKDNINKDVSTVHCQGRVSIGEHEDSIFCDINKLKNECSKVTISSNECYEAYHAMGIDYGPSHRGIEGVWVGNDQLITKICLPEVKDCVESFDRFNLHPSLLDSALQSIVSLLDLNNLPKSPPLPFALESLKIIHRCPTTLWVHVSVTKALRSDNNVQHVDVTLINEEGRVCIQMNGFSSRLLILNDEPVSHVSLSNEAVETLSDKKYGVDRVSKEIVNEVDEKNKILKIRFELLEFMKQACASILNVEKNDIDETEELSNHGFDSITLTEFIRKVNDYFSLELMPTIFFEHTTLVDFIGFLITDYDVKLREKFNINDSENKKNIGENVSIFSGTPQTDGYEIEKQDSSAKRVNSSEEKRNKVAVVGMSGRFPMAGDIDEFWHNLINEKNCISEVPKSRWDWEALYGDPTSEDNKSNIKWGGFIDDIDKFDPSFFNISPHEAQLMDPQQRLLLMYSWKAIEDAGYSPKSLAGSNTAVFVGTLGSGYSDIVENSNIATDSYTATGKVPSVGPNRISYLLDFHGPSEPVETACSSSLIAIHRGAELIANNQCSMALVGGASTMISPQMHIGFTKAGMLSEDGRCKTFSENANGYVRAEGVGMLLLKSLEKAEADGDNIYGVICGSGINHGGRAQSLTAPNSKAQADLIKNIYIGADIDPASIGYIEAHGTGTSLGDPVEIEGLKKAFEAALPEDHINNVSLCGLGSVKSNIGHAELAAGVAGVIKVLLQIKYRTLVKSLHCETLNPYLKLENSPFRVMQKTEKWENLRDDTGNIMPLRAGVSSFGFGGANAHLVVEEYLQSSPSDLELKKYADKNSALQHLFVVSAKTTEQLNESLNNILSYLDKSMPLNEVHMARLIYTLQVGREAMEERFALIVDDAEDLQEKIQIYLNDIKHNNGIQKTENIVNVFRGNTEQKNNDILGFGKDNDFGDLIHKWIKEEKYQKVMSLWVQGVEVNWSHLYQKNEQRISLPTYPFAKERHWVDSDHGSQQLDRSFIGESTAQLHPLVHANTSDLTQQCFESTFTGEEFFLKEHIVGGHQILPGVAHLEIARKAISLSILRSTKILDKGNEFEDDISGILQLQNVVWRHPIITDDEPVNIKIGINQEENGELQYIIYNDALGGDGDPLVYSQGLATVIPTTPSPIIDIQSLLNHRGNTVVSAEQCYAGYKYTGIEHGPSYRGVEKIYVNNEFLISKVSLSKEIVGSKYFLHPGLMDSALQTSIGFLNLDRLPNQPNLPFALHSLTLFGLCPSEFWVIVRRSAEVTKNPLIQKLDIDLCDDTGKVFVRMEGFSSRLAFSNETTPLSDENIIKEDGTTTLMCREEWKNSDLISTSSTAQTINHYCIVISTSDSAKKFSDAVGDKLTDNNILYLTVGDDDSRLDFEKSSVFVFETLQEILLKKNSDKIYVQVILIDKELPFVTGISALFRSVEQEMSKFFGQVISLEHAPKINDDFIATLKNELISDQDKIVRYIQEKRFTMTWKEVPLVSSISPWKNNGIYIITGGFGGLGQVIARDILKSSNQNKVVLIGRRTLNESQVESLCEKMEVSSERIYYLNADVTDAFSVQKSVDWVVNNLGDVNGVIHAAGIISDNYFSKKTSDEIIEVLNPKVAGVINLDHATRKQPLDFFAIFSSTTGSLGNAGQLDYAAANGYLDGYVNTRNKHVSDNLCNGKTFSINWPLWKEGGMQVNEQTLGIMRENVGLIPMGSEHGLNVLYHAISNADDRLMVFEGEIEKIKKFLSGHMLLNSDVESDSLTPSIAALTKNDSEALSSINEPVSYGLLSSVENNKLNNELLLLIKNILKVNPSSVDLNKEFNVYGFDSISLTDFANRINKKYNLKLMPTVFFEYPTLNKIKEYLMSEFPSVFISEKNNNDVIQSSNKEKNTNTDSSIIVSQSRFGKKIHKPETISTEATTSELAKKEKVAIVGISGRFPEADDLEAFWKNLIKGEDCISEIPETRWDWRSPYGKTLSSEEQDKSKWGGFIRDIDKFDPLFFNISPREAELMDPQQRLLMMYTWKAIEDAGYAPKRLAGSNTCVFFGTANGGYNELALNAGLDIEGYTSTGMVPSVGPNRISYLLDLHGPSEPIETACSSSLIAIHRGSELIANGLCDMALVGGVNTIVTPQMHMSFSKAGMLCEDGRCKTFSAEANGYVRGEGVGVLLLKSLSKAEEDGDHIYGLVRGSGENHGGRANSLTAPNPNAQAELLKDVYKISKTDPKTISYIEAHGTGTPLGDPVEIQGLKNAFKSSPNVVQTDVENPECGIGSVKSNIGHLELAAGVAGVIKVLLQMKHKTLVKSLHCESLNPYIDLNNSPFYIVQKNKEWKPLYDELGNSIPRRAGVSSFGFGGSNAHVVLEEYSNRASKRSSEEQNHIAFSPCLIVLSAKNFQQLDESVSNLYEHLQSKMPISQGELCDIAYTLQVGREAMKERFAVVVDDAEDLISKLKSYLNLPKENVDEDSHIDDLFYRSEKTTNSNDFDVFSYDEDMAVTIRTWMEKGKYSKLMSLWVKGLDIDWQVISSEEKLSRVSLPTYPFARKRCWISSGALKQKVPSEMRESVYPLLQRNTSSLSQQQYTSTFHGDEFFLRDHRIHKQKVLPASVYFDMAFAAVLDASQIVEKHATSMMLTDIRLLKPVIVNTESVDVQIRLVPKNTSDGRQKIQFQIGSNNSINSFETNVEGTAHISTSSVSRIDLTEIKKECSVSTINAKDCYKLFLDSNIEFGPAHRGIKCIYVGDCKSLARVEIPEIIQDTNNQFFLHPSLFDGVLQAVIGVMPNVDKAVGTAMPYAIDIVDIIDLNLISSSGGVWAYVKAHMEDNKSGDDALPRIDIDICNDDGLIGARIRGVSYTLLKNKYVLQPITRPNDRIDNLLTQGLMGDVTLESNWEELNTKNIVTMPLSGPTLLIGADVYTFDSLSNTASKVVQWPNLTELLKGDTTERFNQISDIENIVWQIPRVEVDGVSVKNLAHVHRRSIVEAFCLIKLFLENGFKDRLLKWIVITDMRPTTDQVCPAHAAIHGLISVTIKEHENWTFRLFDISSDEKFPVDLLTIDKGDKDFPWALINRKWHHLQLLPVTRASTQEVTPYVTGGIYIIIGGAGGLGQIFSDYLIREQNANVIWIGRSSLGESIQNEISKYTHLSGSLKYIQADASIYSQIAAAYENIKIEYGAVNGVILATTGPLDNNIASMSETEFNDLLPAKIDACINLGSILENESLDFISLFSSMVSFTKDQGKVGYCAANSFIDSYAEFLEKSREKNNLKGKVSVINWGFWNAGIGKEIPQSMKLRLKTLGVLPISNQSGIQLFNDSLTSQVRQVAFLATEKNAELDSINLEKIVTYYATKFDDVVPVMLTNIEPSRARFEKEINNISPADEFEYLLSIRLASVLIEIGVPSKKSFSPDIVRSIVRNGKVSTRYERWLETSIDILIDKNILIKDSDQNLYFAKQIPESKSILIEWDRKLSTWLSGNTLVSHGRLVDLTLNSLTDILSSKELATDVIFSQGDLSAVEAVYRDNPVAVAYNDLLAESVVSYVNARLDLNPNEKIRIIEIGGGTGGSTDTILKKLVHFNDKIMEYCFTDISQSFLQAAEAKYKNNHPFFKTKILNIEKNPEEQGVAPDHYDIVIAANVLHATHDIIKTLKNVKVILRKNSVLLLNEISRRSLFTHLTFGLLDGWWLYRDPEHRISGSPALSEENWHSVLKDTGYENILFPSEAFHDRGQQIVIASSDGRVISDANPLGRDMSLDTTVKETPLDDSSYVFSEKNNPSSEMDLLSNTHKFIRDVVSKVLKVPSDSLDNGDSFQEYGMDSILVGQLTKVLSDIFGKVNSALLFEKNTVNLLSSHFIKTHKSFLDEMFSSAVDESMNSTKSKIDTDPIPVDTYSSRFVSPNAQASFDLEPLRSKEVNNESVAVKELDRTKENLFNVGSEASKKDDPIVIVGLSGKYPKADNLSEFWQNLLEGKNCIDEIPKDRWSIDDFYLPGRQAAINAGKSYSKWGGFINGFSNFDPQFFGISPREALNIDPQERLFLEYCWLALEDAGYTPELLANNYGGRVGVYAGITKTGFELHSRPLVNEGKRFYPRTSFSSVANRVSFLFDFNGPSMPIDTMCSSSLTAVHEACEQIKRNECDSALVGGVNLYLHPSSYTDLCAHQMLSDNGYCKSFADDADGFVPGEGVGVIYIKRLSQAKKDGDHIYGVIRSTSVNHGGKTNGYTVPSPAAQKELIRMALEKGNVNAREISVIEAHGTGTRLGDPIEISGLEQAFTKDTSDLQFCAISSVKSNIGHCESAAGIAGLTKVLLQLQHKKLVPSLHAGTPNSNIDFALSPFYIQQKLSDWQSPAMIDGGTEARTRKACISGFGAGGANAHIIIEEYIDDDVELIDNPSPQLIVLSAKSKNQLNTLAENLLAYLNSPELASRVSLLDIAFTLQFGRRELEHRLAITTMSKKQLQQQLESYILGSKDVDGVFRGKVTKADKPNQRNNKNEIVSLIDQARLTGEYKNVAQHWIVGGLLDWVTLWADRKARRISLPTYPFGHEKYWVESQKPSNTFQKKSIKKLIVSNDSTNNKITISDTDQSNVSEKKDRDSDVFVDEKPFLISLKNIDNSVSSVSDPANYKKIKEHFNHEDYIKLIVESLSTALYLEPNDIDKNASFVDLGLDSVIGIEWIQSLNKMFDLSLPSSIIYDNPTCLDLAQEISRLKNSESKTIDICDKTIEKTDLKSYSKSNSVELVDVSSNENLDVESQYLSEKFACQELKESLAKSLYLESNNIDVNASFVDLGLDSVIGIEWIQSLNKIFELSLPSSIIYDKPTCLDLAQEISRLKNSESKTIDICDKSIEKIELKSYSKSNSVKLVDVSSNENPDVGSQYLSEDFACQELKESLAESLYLEPNNIDVNASFVDLGLDSVIGIEWIQSLNKVFDLSLPSSIIYDKPTCLLLAKEISRLKNSEPKTAVKFNNTIVKNTPTSYSESSSIELSRTRENENTQSESQGLTKGDVCQWLDQSLADVLYIEKKSIDRDTVFIELGMDSVLGIEWLDKIIKEYNTPIHSSAIYDHPTINSLSVHIISLLKNEPKKAQKTNSKHTLTPLGKAPLVSDDRTQERPKTDVIRKELIDELASVLYMKKPDIDPDTPFIDNGLDSVVGLEWIEMINRRYSKKLPSSILYDYPTINRLSSFITSIISSAVNGRVEAETSQRSQEKNTRQRPSVKKLSIKNLSIKKSSDIENDDYKNQTQYNSTKKDESIAIIGVSGRYPGANNISEYWDNIASGKNSVNEIPKSRWDWQKHFDMKRPSPEGKIYCRWLGNIEDIECFDPLFFNISPSEAEAMDPQQRMFLQEAYRAFEDSGYNSDELSQKNCGVYLGITSSEYGAIQYRYGVDADTTGNSPAIAAARIAYYLNLKGPAIPVDTACSSSLVATHLASQALQRGEINMALVGGVTLYLTPEPYMNMCKAGMLSSDGQCKVCDNKADGFVPADGVGTLLLKRLSDAERDNDHIYGVIVASGLNQDGKTNGITAPSASSQTDLLNDIYQRYDIDAGTISYVEMHGTGTKLGDPIELEALDTVFSRARRDLNYCALGSVKSNIGHTTAAAGVAGIQKVLLAMKNNTLPPTINFQTPNEHYDFESSPFYVNNKLSPWRVSGPKRAGISSFGFSGTNAHIVIEEYLDKRVSNIAEVHNPFVIVLSAETETQLNTIASNLLKFVENTNLIDQAQLQRIAYTLQIGRKAMSVRLACVVQNSEELCSNLQNFLSGDKKETYFTKANVKLSGIQGEQNLNKLALSWVRGDAVDWSALYNGKTPVRISLPAYPFLKEKYWLNIEIENSSLSGNISDDGIRNNLNYLNVSGISGLRFNTSISEKEHFIKDHEVNGEIVVPGVIYLEIARATFLLAKQLPSTSVSISKGQEEYIVRIKNLVWSEVLRIDSPEILQTRIVKRDDDVVFEVGCLNSKNEMEFDKKCDGQLTLVKRKKDIQLTNDTIKELNLHVYDDVSSYTKINKIINADKHLQFFGDDCYQEFRNMGIDYGRSFQCIDTLIVSETHVFAKLIFSGSEIESLDNMLLHPSMIDSALQASVGFLFSDGEISANETYLPFSLKSIDVYSFCREKMWVKISRSKLDQEMMHSNETGETVMFDMEVYDEFGNICFIIHKFLARKINSAPMPVSLENSNEWKNVLLAPRWSKDNDALVSNSKTELYGKSSKTIFINIDRDDQTINKVRESFPDVIDFIVDQNENLHQLCERFSTLGHIGHVIWVDSALFQNEHNYLKREGSFTKLIDDQSKGVITCFQVIKALLKLEYGSKILHCTVITCKSQAFNHDDYVNPQHASIHGFMGVVAKEYSRWKINAIDLESANDWTDDLWKLIPSDQGNTSIFRNGSWYRQILEETEVSSGNNILYKNDGVYIVIGGAGGLGEWWSESMIRRFNAKIIWLGRSPENDVIKEKIHRLASLGTPPEYFSVDASNITSLAYVYATIKKRFKNINGIVHAALDLHDKSLMNMDLTNFNKGITAKIHTCVNVAEVFASENLDFFLFFSSLQSFTRLAGQCNYAAGSTFNDAFAKAIAKSWTCPIKVMNWGYWGSMGAVASESYRSRNEAQGVGAIDPEEAVIALDLFMSCHLDQLGFVTVNKDFNLKEESESLDKKLEAAVDDEMDNDSFWHDTTNIYGDILNELSQFIVEE